MTIDTTPPMPDLDDMLQSLLLVEEGEHEFIGDGEIQELRHLFFPITRHSVYLNHASTGPLPRPVARTLHEYVDDTSNFGGTHEPRWAEYERGVHRRLATLLSARPDQIALTASTGDGLMLIAQGLDWHRGDNIVSTQDEFPTNVYPWLNLEEYGVSVYAVPAQTHRIVTEDIVASITERTRLVSLSLVEFSTGYRNDIARIAQYCHERGILCGIDAMQALGALEIDVQALGVDFLAAAAHKWVLGPHMCGILYIADGLLEQLKARRRGWWSVETPFDFFNHRQPLKAGAARFEHSSPNSLPIVGLDAALGVFECLDGGMEAVEARVLGLTTYALAGLQRLGYPVISPRGAGECSGILCFEPHPERADLNAEQVADILAVQNIHVASRSGIVRISPHFYNVPTDIDTLLNALEEIKKPLVVK